MGQVIQKDAVSSWMQHMRSGKFEEAWKISDAVLRSRNGKPCRHLPRHLQYVWSGTPLTGKHVLVRCYHGLGDTIQFIRYAPLVAAVAASVMVWAQPPLIPLLQTMTGIHQLLPLHEGTPDAMFDVDVEVMELPHVFRTTAATIPSETPYLQALPLSAPKQGLAVGLVWKAGDWDERRSLPFSLLAPLARIPGITVYLLQQDAPAAGWQGQFGIYPGEFCLSDFARVVSGLDVLISVDSMPAHLAGALGVPVWNLLHAQADWRWMEERTDSPWYPSMRLFRQEHPGEWQPVINRVAAELEQLSKQPGQTTSV